MYEARPDPYCYMGSTVLKNIPGLHTQSALDRFETVAVADRASQPFPRGRLSLTHYCAFHRHLFQDVYRWSGRFRSVRIAKGEAVFCYPENIAEQMRRLFNQLRRATYFSDLSTDEFAQRAAHFLSELNAIQPFREGNGRCQNAFLGLLAARAGHSLDLSLLDEKAYLTAMIESFQGREGPLSEQLRHILDR